jgi:hypothetical protein
MTAGAGLMAAGTIPASIPSPALLIASRLIERDAPT